MTSSANVPGSEGISEAFQERRPRANYPSDEVDRGLRIIQEGLVNSMKHAPGAPVSVTLEVTATGLNVDIINGPARSAPLELDGCGGAGLLGMTERVKAHGGQLSAAPVPGGGWRVAASLPSGTHPGLAATRAPGHEPHDDEDGHRDQPDDDKRLERSHDPGRSRDGKPYGEDRAEDCPDDPAHVPSMPPDPGRR
jgi:hypothetical protein